MTKRKTRAWAPLVAFAVAVVAASATAIALAQDGSTGDTQSSPDAGAPSGQATVPKGPFIDFCPTPEQSEAHLRAYGFDYKPTVGCNREGEVAPPTPEQQAGTVEDPDENLTAPERLARLKQELLDSRPVANEDSDPLTIEGVTADGQRFDLEIQGDPDVFRGMTPAEFARSLP